MNVSKHSLKRYLRLTKSTKTESCNELLLMWADEHLANIDLRILNIETLVEGYTLIVLSYAEYARVAFTPVDAEREIKEKVDSVRGDVLALAKELRIIKVERSKFLNDPLWGKAGREPNSSGSKSILTPETLQLFPFF